MVYLSYIFVYSSCAVLPTHLHLHFLSFSHPYSLSHPVIPGLAGGLSLWEVKGHPWVRGRLCGHHAFLFPQSTSNAAEPWPQWVLTLKISEESNSVSQTLLRAGLSIGGKKEPPLCPHPNCDQCPSFVFWSSRVGWPAATTQDKTSEKPIQHVTWPSGSIADAQGSNAGNLWGFSSLEIFYPLKFTHLTKLKMPFFPKVLQVWEVFHPDAGEDCCFRLTNIFIPQVSRSNMSYVDLNYIMIHKFKYQEQGIYELLIRVLFLSW